MSGQEEPRIPAHDTNHQNQINDNLRNNQQQNNSNLNGSFKITNNLNNKNGKVPQLSVIKNGTGQQTVNGGLNDDWKNFTGNGNGLNNNQEEYKLENKKDTTNWVMEPTVLPANNNNGVGKLNGNADKLAEEDPLTGHKAFEKDPDDDITCGIGTCQPRWARKFASTNFFLVVFLMAWVLQGMYFTYFVSVITTIEKLFQIKSRTIGMLLSFSEVGQICTSLFLTYYAGRGHRPRWIACGMILFAISAFGSVTPHFMFGEQLYKQVAMKASISTSTNAVDNTQYNLCSLDQSKNLTGDASDLSCSQENEMSSDHIEFILTIFAVSLLGIGVGQTAISTLGIPYIDDNVSSRDSPIYMAITIGVRILGPAAGFILGSFCTRIYVDLSKTNFGIETADPKWIGAWWLGLLLVSSLMAMASFVMFMFPRNFRGKKVTAPPPVKLLDEESAEKSKKVVKVEEVEDQTPKFRDFPKTLKRQLKNDILMFRTASSVLHLLPVAGLYTFLPKYLETQFRVTTHDSALISGIGGISVMGIGIAISGIVILKITPSARSVAAWIAFTALIYSAGMALLTQIGCPMHDFNGLKAISEHNNGIVPKMIIPSCDLSCECNFDELSPICGSNGVTYFSSCHAGCTNATKMGDSVEYSECKCITTPELMNKFGSATNGYCKDDCNSVYLFVVMFALFVFVHSTSEVGSMLLIMRCTHPKDKAMAMGIIQFAIGLFGNIPCPIIYGAVIDSACKVWGMICGKQGYCSLYDSDMFRHHFLGITSLIMGLAFIMDVVVWYKANRIDIDPESSPKVATVEDGKHNPVCNEDEALNEEQAAKLNVS